MGSKSVSKDTPKEAFVKRVWQKNEDEYEEWLKDFFTAVDFNKKKPYFLSAGKNAKTEYGAYATNYAEDDSKDESKKMDNQRLEELYQDKCKPDDDYLRMDFTEIFTQKRKPDFTQKIFCAIDMFLNLRNGV